MLTRQTLGPRTDSRPRQVFDASSFQRPVNLRRIACLALMLVLTGCSSPADPGPRAAPATTRAATISSSAATSAASHTTTQTSAAIPTSTSNATSTSSISVSSTVTPDPDPGFTSSTSEITPALAARMSLSWRPGCPVPLADLRYLTVGYWGFDGLAHQGELVVAESAAAGVIAVFGQLYLARYPINSMRLVDEYAADDNASMTADNTSAFNCREVTGGGGFSEHSTGLALDLNPRENPYLSDGIVLPPSGSDFISRPAAPGVIHDGDTVVLAFAQIGWSWGGRWTDPIDYQHFSASGR